ncbi:MULTISPECIES: NTP/NDP exchange transporter [Parachlamydia]|jgi:AAA family ATP:ADP antiporter|uniref:ADP,ATP carrier protein n=3 Tax=Parachlamydia acanthamoebae TaxID=83552 RepID=F8KVN2_PARAV|nr:NTP/NDP exchange transporter [Parachlamydia acanthamoebae]AAQ06407.1 ADP-ATP translocase [Parachlamydia acanthamoebae str. Hall's coccus]EFB42215.1 ADP/ATP translocase [Parachlamydia acanthamoebae str. Hall's coccus]KIA76370.1 ADP,ATP carrier protein 1 [Parachlamydia acanthamoebae]CCB85168.1 ADP,ATP carrier protein 1 [Parachlamydia acanthamoebae UV-7]
MTNESKPEFGPLRSFFWPVHNYELRKLLPMFLMFFCISFNYTILRDTKDTLIVTSSGAEAIPFLKVWGVVPAAIIFMLLYAKLSNILSKEKLFYVTITPFIVFFALFATVLYPNKDFLHPTTSAEYIQSFLPEGLGGLVACYRNWTYSLFYILSELWGSAVLSLMFWGFANDIMKITEAKRFYTLLGLGANVALLVSGPAIMYFSDIRKHLPAGVDAWQVSLNYLMGSVVLAGVCVVAVYWWMQRNVMTDPRYYDPSDVKQPKKAKAKMSIMESFAFLGKSKYILCIAILVICYGISINLVEVTWKNQLKLQYPNPNEYNTFMGAFSTFTGAITIIMMFVGGYIVRKKGWGFAAMTTPTVLLLTGLGFFSFVIFRDSLQGYIAMLGTTPLMLAVVIGMIQNIMSKSTKYSLFDPTKEMAYIPLDQESKVKGKAAIDVVGARLGKSGGSFIQQGLLVFFGTISAITPYVAVATIAVIVVWMIAVRSLNKQFVALTGETIAKPAVPVAAVKAATETTAA